MVIYKITNLTNGKIYIGQTINLKKRIKTHKYASTMKCYKTSYATPIHRAMRKYGFENFKFEIIDEAQSAEELDEKERFHIKQEDSCVYSGKGYNIKSGGSGNYDISRKNQQISQLGEFNHSFGKHGSKSVNNRAKRIINVTTQIVYDSMYECAVAEYGDKKYLKQISKVCDPYSNRVTYRGNIYKALNNDGTTVEKAKENIVSNVAFKKVRIIEKISGLVFETIQDASRHFEIRSEMIRDRIYHRIKNDKFKGEIEFEIYNDNMLTVSVE